ncbi:MAG: hypothetical protein J0M02_17540, partial [Planctomycetes bacterium]|nr:hypothetical protein [Planctomycetota bacterium]
MPNRTLLALLLATALSAAQATIVEYPTPSWTPKALPPAPYTDAQFAYQYIVPASDDPNQNKLHYRLFTPPSYAGSGSAKHPLVFFLHGDGEKEDGTIYNQSQMRDNGQYAFCSASSQAVLPCFFALVQTSWWGRAGGARTAADLAIALAAKYRIDPDRIFVTGLSGGGGATLAWAGKQPATWAGFVALSAPNPGDPGAYLPANLATIPSWFFAAKDDRTVGSGNQDGQVLDLRQRGARPIYTLYNSGGHSKSTWGAAYGCMPMIRWMAEQRRGQTVAQPVEVAITAPTSAQTWNSTAASAQLAGTVSDRQLSGGSSGITAVACQNAGGAQAAIGGTIAAWTSGSLALAAGDTWVLATATGSSFDSARGGTTTYCDVMLVKRTTSANAAPVVDAGADQAVALPALASLTGSASDDGLPAASTLAYAWSLVSGPGTATFATPAQAATTAAFSAAGTYVLQLTASDGALAASDTVTITVTATAPAGEQTILVDLGASGARTAGSWNNLCDGGLTVTDAIDSSGAATGIGLAASGFAWPSSMGVASSALFPASAQSDFLYVTGTATGRIAITGLPDGATWDVEIFASRLYANAVAVYGIGTETRTLNAYGNTATLARFTGLNATGGSLLITVTPASGSSEADIGVIRLTRRAVVAATRTLQVDFGDPATPTAGAWNNLTSPTSGAIANAIDSTGAATGIGIAVTDAFAWINSQGVAGDGAVPAAAARDSFYVDAANPVGVVTISGLDPAKVYDAELFASRLYNAASGTVYASGASTATLNAYNNTSATARLIGLGASGGSLAISVRAGSATGMGYL